MTDATPNFSVRSEPATRTAPEVLARIFGKEEKLPEKKARLQAECHPHEIVTPGHEVPLSDVVKHTKAGKMSTQSIMGKVAAHVLANGGEVKAGLSEYFSGDRVKPVNVKKEGRKQAVTDDYVVDPGEMKQHKWLAFLMLGRVGTVVGSQIEWAGRDWSWEEFQNEHRLH